MGPETRLLEIGLKMQIINISSILKIQHLLLKSSKHNEHYLRSKHNEHYLRSIRIFCFQTVQNLFINLLILSSTFLIIQYSFTSTVYSEFQQYTADCSFNHFILKRFKVKFPFLCVLPILYGIDTELLKDATRVSPSISCVGCRGRTQERTFSCILK